MPMLLREEVLLLVVADDCRVLIGCCCCFEVVVDVVLVVVDGAGGIVVAVAAAAVVTSVVVVVVDLDIDCTAAAVDDNLDPMADLLDFAPGSIADWDIDTIVAPIAFVVVAGGVVVHLQLHHPMTYFSFHLVYSQHHALASLYLLRYHQAVIELMIPLRL